MEYLEQLYIGNN